MRGAEPDRPRVARGPPQMPRLGRAGRCVGCLWRWKRGCNRRRGETQHCHLGIALPSSHLSMTTYPSSGCGTSSKRPACVQMPYSLLRQAPSAERRAGLIAAVRTLPVSPSRPSCPSCTFCTSCTLSLALSLWPSASPLTPFLTTPLQRPEPGLAGRAGIAAQKAPFWPLAQEPRAPPPGARTTDHRVTSRLETHGVGVVLEPAAEATAAQPTPAKLDPSGCAPATAVGVRQERKIAQARACSTGQTGLSEKRRFLAALAAAGLACPRVETSSTRPGRSWVPGTLFLINARCPQQVAEVCRPGQRAGGFAPLHPHPHSARPLRVTVCPTNWGKAGAPQPAPT